MPAYWDDSFAPEEIQLLSAALDRAWAFVEKSGEFGMDAPEHCRSSLAIHVMAIARTGERDPLRLANSAIQRYRQQRAQQFAAANRKRADESAAK
jgi:hypothetical protein